MARDDFDEYDVGDADLDAQSFGSFFNWTVLTEAISGDRTWSILAKSVSIGFVVAAVSAGLEPSFLTRLATTLGAAVAILSLVALVLHGSRNWWRRR